MRSPLKILFIIAIIITTHAFSDSHSREKLLENQAIKHSFSVESLMKPTSGRPDYLPETYLSKNNNFKIHYTTEGTHAVPSESTNADNVPDFVYVAAEAAERAYFVLVDSLGFDAPPVDGIDGDEFDIYIKNFGGSQYALTYPENPVHETSRPYDYTSYLEVDNDYTESAYYTKGLDALRVTVAHEFFHMIQLGYNFDTSSYLDRMSQGDRFFFEWNSTWFEDFSYPQVNDYINYAKSYSYYPDDSIWSSSYWYSHGIFMKFIIDNYSIDIIKKTWNKIKNEERAFYALQSTIEEETNRTLSELYNEYCQRMYFTGMRYDDDLAVSTDAQYFPYLRINWSDRYEYDKYLDINNDIPAFATLPIDVAFSDNQHFGLMAKNGFSGDFEGSYIFDDNNRITTGFFNLNSDQYIGKSSYGDTLTLFITNKSESNSKSLSLSIDFMDPPNLLAINKIFPNPVDANGRITLTISTSEATEKLTLSCYNLLGQKLFMKDIPKSASHQYALTFSEFVNYPLASGIYLLKVKADGKEELKKFTIIK
ncbi:MAG: MXAN_6640 family putative metalloprotease [Fidelibacterota bacterium]